MVTSGSQTFLMIFELNKTSSKTVGKTSVKSPKYFSILNTQNIIHFHHVLDPHCSEGIHHRTLGKGKIEKIKQNRKINNPKMIIIIEGNQQTFLFLKFVQKHVPPNDILPKCPVVTIQSSIWAK